MFFFLKSLSRSVHEEHQEPEFKTHGATCTTLTVWRKSLVISCRGFTVIDSDGNLVYRVDNYVGGCPDELTLMDGDGRPVLTMHRRKRLRLGESWVIYEGEVGDCCSSTAKLSKKPIWYVRKNIGINILQSNQNVIAWVNRRLCDKRSAYVIEGSYTQRSCKVLDESNRVVAEIKRKEAGVGGVSFGAEVFVLVVQPGFDSGFAMALVLLLDQMFS